MRLLSKSLTRICLANIPCLPFRNANGHWDDLGSRSDAETSFARHSRKSDTGRPFHHCPTATAGVIREWSPTTAAEEAMKEPLRQHLGARSWSVPSLGSRRNLLRRAGRIGCAGWKVSGNRFDDCKSEPSLNCEQDSRLWSIPNAERRVTTKPSKPANLQRFGGLGGFCFNQCVLHQTVFGE